jgi:hypothetical protein
VPFSTPPPRIHPHFFVSKEIDYVAFSGFVYEPEAGSWPMLTWGGTLKTRQS